jgi:hypothetical protein
LLALADGALIVFLLTVEILKPIPTRRWQPDRQKTIPL